MNKSDDMCWLYFSQEMPLVPKCRCIGTKILTLCCNFIDIFCLGYLYIYVFNLIPFMAELRSNEHFYKVYQKRQQGS